MSNIEMKYNFERKYGILSQQIATQILSGKLLEDAPSSKSCNARMQPLSK